MQTTLKLGSIEVDVVRKDIKNVHMSVYPPSGRVRIAAPARMTIETIRAFAISRLAWIKAQQRKIVLQDRETQREYLERESHYLWGKRYLLHIVCGNGPTHVELSGRRLTVHTRGSASPERLEEILESWYRSQLRQMVLPIVAKWEPVIGVKVERVFIQRMKTKWGSCSRKTPSIRLNTELTKKPRECVEYVVVHEMAHLVHANHGTGFQQILNGIFPMWREYRQGLNQLPVRHETWRY